MTVPNNFITSQVKVADTREETLMGRKHLVVPVVALVEMVLESSTSDAPELALAEEFGANPLAWNGRPIVVNHPELNGEKVSASLTDVVDKEKIGEIYNTVVDDKKLKLEAWIDLERAESLGGVISDTVAKLQSGEEIIEVSTGLFSNIEKKAGKFNEKDYKGVWRNVVPDHLAILSEATGACSIEDGCGAPRANTAAASCACPVHDDPAAAKSLFAKVKDKWNIFRIAGTGMTNEAKRNFLSTAIREKLGTRYVWLMAVYEDTVVFETDDGLFELAYSMSDDIVTFSEDEPTAVVAQVDFVPPLTVNDDGSITMDKAKFIDKLVANEGNKFEESDKEWLNKLDEGSLAKFESLAEAAPEPTPTPTPTPAPAAVPADGAPVKPDTDEAVPITLEKYIEDAPAEVGAVLSEGIRLQEEKRSSLIASVIANEKNVFTEDELKVMATPALEGMAKLAGSEDYSGRGAPRTQTTDPNAPPPMPKVFEARKPDAGTTAAVA